jgi:hypothetical protein
MASAVDGIPDSILAQIAIGIPPNGTKSNFIDPPNSGNAMIVLGAVLLPVMGVFFAIRLYTKARIIRKYSWDDCKLGNAGYLMKYPVNMNNSDLFDCGSKNMFLLQFPDINQLP